MPGPASGTAMRVKYSAGMPHAIGHSISARCLKIARTIHKSAQRDQLVTQISPTYVFRQADLLVVERQRSSTATVAQSGNDSSVKAMSSLSGNLNRAKA